MATQPQTMACKMKAHLEYIHVAHMFFACLAPICMLSRCFIDKISASELRQKFIKGALLAGQDRYSRLQIRTW